MEYFNSIIMMSVLSMITLNTNPTKMNKSINENAPVVEKQETFIPATPELVWEVISNINQWPEWQSDVTQAELFGELQEGATFKWKAGGIQFKSELHTVIEHHAIGWTGKTFGAKAIHNWYFEEKDGGTMVYVEESLQGLFPGLLKKRISENLREGMKKNLVELTSACSNQTTE